MHKGLFDTNSSALKKRIEINNNSDNNLEDWIINNLNLNEGMSILDLGCGTGKQIKAIKKKYDVNIIGIDLALDALDYSDENLTLIHGNFDKNFIFGKFDRIISTYAIYYSKNMYKTLRKYMSMLNNNGYMFISGAGNETNKEIYNIINNLIKDKKMNIIPRNTFDFMDISKINFAKTKISRLENKINFESKEKVMEWWSNHNSYIKELHDDVKNQLPQNLRLTKNVLGVSLFA